MGATLGQVYKLTIFGESHGKGVGGVIDGIPPGISLDMSAISRELMRRAPGNSPFTSARQETDGVDILSGVYQGHTTGTPLAFVILNKDMRSDDYEKSMDIPRPSHADYTGFVKYKGFNDPRGGGHFSGRLTAPIVVAGAIARQVLHGMGVRVLSRIASIGNVEESVLSSDRAQWDKIADKAFPVFDDAKEHAMKACILDARQSKDSVGGVIQGIAFGIKPGIGSPFFDTIEGELSKGLFAIPGVKGVSFGDGFDIAKKRGSEVNDTMCFDQGVITHMTNHNGGVLGGISNGMPLVVNVAFKPTPSIGQPQQTVALRSSENLIHTFSGRHDPCIVPRAVPVVESLLAMVLLDQVLRAD